MRLVVWPVTKQSWICINYNTDLKKALVSVLLLFCLSSLTDLERSRDDLLFELHKQTKQSPTDVNVSYDSLPYNVNVNLPISATLN